MEAYSKFISTGIPFVTAKFAMSLDVKIATSSGDSRWITSELARQEVHRLRYTADAILVGVNTVLTDDPRLTVRCCGSGGVPKKQPLRVIVDSLGRTPLTAQVFKEPGKTAIAVTKGLTQKRRSGFANIGAEVVELPSSEGGVDLSELFKALGEREITSVLVEGGSTLLGSLFDGKLVDKVVAFIAPIIIGGEKAKTAVGGIGVDRIADSLRLSRISIKRFGDDVMVSGYVGS